jgi:hypothetical protein
MDVDDALDPREGCALERPRRVLPRVRSVAEGNSDRIRHERHDRFGLRDAELVPEALIDDEQDAAAVLRVGA